MAVTYMSAITGELVLGAIEVGADLNATARRRYVLLRAVRNRCSDAVGGSWLRVLTHI